MARQVRCDFGCVFQNIASILPCGNSGGVREGWKPVSMPQPHRSGVNGKATR